MKNSFSVTLFLIGCMLMHSECCAMGPAKSLNEITKEERKRLLQLLKKLEFTIKDFRPVEEAIITCGGIDTKEINPKTMESLDCKNLYCVGEILDSDY